MNAETEGKMNAGRCGYCDCGEYDPSDGRTREEDGTPICWCGHTEMAHADDRR